MATIVILGDVEVEILDVSPKELALSYQLQRNNLAQADLRKVGMFLCRCGEVSPLAMRIQVGYREFCPHCAPPD